MASGINLASGGSIRLYSLLARCHTVGLVGLPELRKEEAAKRAYPSLRRVKWSPLIRLRNMKTRLMNFAVLILLMAVVSTVSGCNKNIAGIRTEGNTIVFAIAQYRTSNGGILPSSLTALIPKYLASSPAYKWQYTVFRSAAGRDEFLLTCGEGGWSFHQFDSITGKWASSQPAD